MKYDVYYVIHAYKFKFLKLKFVSVGYFDNCAVCIDPNFSHAYRFKNIEDSKRVIEELKQIGFKYKIEMVINENIMNNIKSKNGGYVLY